jgi:hypothetical protein
MGRHPLDPLLVVLGAPGDPPLPKIDFLPPQTDDGATPPSGGAGQEQRQLEPDPPESSTFLGSFAAS